MSRPSNESSPSTAGVRFGDGNFNAKLNISVAVVKRDDGSFPVIGVRPSNTFKRHRKDQIIKRATQTHAVARMQRGGNCSRVNQKVDAPHDSQTW